VNHIKGRPILFSAPMVRAILEGRKTVTRRAVKPQYEDKVWTVRPASEPRHARHSDDWWLPTGSQPYSALPRCPYGEPGDRLWVRETWARVGNDDPGYLTFGATYPACLPADMENIPLANEIRWKPSIHMFRKDSRILLEVTAVRVERLQDGEGETDFESRYVAEGINRIHHGDGEHHYHAFKSEPGPGNWNDPFDAWRELWVSVSGAESWNSNPWVWVVEFKRVTP
jgi:hypothetical protein